MKLLIVRHGDPDYSIDSLTETGWKEAALLSDRLSRLEVRACYCSPLGRAKDTATATLKKLGMEAEICPWLREFAPLVHKPDRDGIAWDWLPQDWTACPEFFDKDRWLEHPAFVGSDVPREYRWVCDGLDELLARHGYVRQGNLYRAEKPNEDTIILFCHFGLESVLLSRLLNVSPMILWHGTCALTSSVTTLITEERREGFAYFRMNGFGDISHLYAAGQEPSFSARFCETFANQDQRHD